MAEAAANGRIGTLHRIRLFRFRDGRFFDMWYLLDLATIRDQLERRGG